MLSILSRIFVVLLLGHMLLSQCAACIPSPPQSHGCCQKHSAPATKNHCGKPSPPTASCTAKDQAAALDRDGAAPQVLAPATVAAVLVQAVTELPTPQSAVFNEPRAPYSSPPLFVLHASYLI
jgi:hypothetical protein